jgi:hypothetical protein
MDHLQHFLDVSASAPPERDTRHFRTWQRVSVEVQRGVRTLVAQTFLDGDIDRAFTIVVYSCCQPCYGRRPMEFAYDFGDAATLSSALRLIGRSLKARLAVLSERITDPRLKRRFAPVWHLDILQTAKNKPRLLIELLAREASMVNALIDLGTVGTERSARKFVKAVVAVARVAGVDSTVLQDLVLRTGVENLVDGRVFEDDDSLAAGSPDARIGGDEYRDHGSADGCGQMADAGIVSDVHACG